MFNYSIRLILVAMFAVLLACGGALALPLLEIREVDSKTSDFEVSLGANFSVEVVLSGMSPGDMLFDYDLQLEFNDSVLQFAGYQFMSGLDTDPFYSSGQSHSGNMLGFFEFSFFDSITFNDQADELTLLTIEFTSIGYGDSALTLLGPPYNEDMPIIGDGMAGSYQLQLRHGRAETPVPEPATMLLFGTGLAGLSFYRRRKSP